MKIILRYIPTLLTAAALLSACATPLPPEGGPKDETPPKIDTTKSTPSEQVNFTKQTIELAFDEWIVLEDINNQVLISPPLEFRPDIRLKRRTVLFDFNEKENLRPNVTYTVNFGAAVKDLTEKNPAEDLRFVFSTGPVLDSLRVRGRLLDALTGEPVDKAVFMLYENFADSVVRKERPLYFGKTDKQGEFLIKNIRAGQFKGFALTDANLNYRFDVANEKIGFPEGPVVAEAGQEANLTIYLFTEAAAPRRLSQDTTTYGLLKAVYNFPPSELQVQPDSTGLPVVALPGKDTLYVWYTPEKMDRPVALYVQRDSTLSDTLHIRLPKTPGARPAFRIVEGGDPVRPVRLNPTQALALSFSTPLGAVDTSKIRFFEKPDSVESAIALPDIRIDSADARRLVVRHNWRQEANYRLEFAPRALTDLYGQSPDTTTSYAYYAEPLRSFGNILLTITGLHPDYPFLLELLDSGGQPIITRQLPAGLTESKQEFRTFTPGTYGLRLVEDRNSNGRWDAGSYELYRQPERIFLKKLEQLRANWDLEAEVKLEK